MISKLYIEGKQYRPSPSDVLGSGGEGTVVRLTSISDKVAKVWHQPDRNRARKLEAMLKISQWPRNVLAPIDCVYDQNDAIVGFTMPLSPKGDDWNNLANRQWRQRRPDIDTEKILLLAANAKETLDAIHNSQVVVGDLNDLGIMINGDTTTTWMDVDSFQIPNFPCVVAMERFIDPRLFHTSLDDGQAHFDRESDRYALSVMLFVGMFITHPYGGVHAAYKDLLSRVAAKIDLWSKDVRRPPITLPREIASDDLLSLFDDYFRKGKRPEFTVDFLRRQAGFLVMCDKCHVKFATGRRSCPVCSTTVVSPPPSIVGKTITIADIDYEQIYSALADEDIVHCQIMGRGLEQIIWTTASTTKLVQRRSVDLGAHVSSKNLPSSGHGQKILATEDVAWSVTRSGHISASPLDDKIRLSVNDGWETGLYGNRPVAATSKNYCYRIYGFQLLRIRIDKYGHVLEESVGTIMPNQTWFMVGTDDSIVGFQRLFNAIQWFAITKEHGQIVLPTIATAATSRMVEWSVHLDEEHRTALLLRRVVHNGKEKIFLDAIHFDGKPIWNTAVEVGVDDVLSSSIRGRAIMGGAVAHPTDDGLVIDDGKHRRAFASSATFVNSDDLLSFYRDGILVVSRKRLGILRVRKSV